MSVRNDIERLVGDLRDLRRRTEVAETTAQRALEHVEAGDYAHARTALDRMADAWPPNGATGPDDLIRDAEGIAGDIEENTHV